MGAETQPRAVLRGEFNGRKLAERSGAPREVRAIFEEASRRLHLTSGKDRAIGWVSWSIDGQLVGHVTSPGYVRQFRCSAPLVWHAEEPE